MDNRSPVLSIIIPAFGRPDELRVCLSAVFANDLTDVEVIVVNDGCSNLRREKITADFDVKFLDLPSNIGRGPARNRGAESAEGTFLLFIDADIEIPSSLLTRVKEILKRRPEIDAFFGSYDDEPACPRSVSQYRNLLHHYTHQQAGHLAHHFWTGFGVVRRTTFQEVGGFDQGKWARNMEEVELGHRLNAANHPIRLFKDLQLKHLKSYTLRSMIKSDLLDRAIPWTLFIHEVKPPENAFVTSTRQRLSAIAVVLMLCLPLTVFIGAWGVGLFLAGLISFLLFNAPFIIFCFKKRGAIFAIKAAIYHMIHIFCAGLGYVAGTVLHFWKRVSGTAKPCQSAVETY